MKVCTKCGVEKPATPEFYGGANTTRDGFRPECKKCKSRIDALRRNQRESSDPIQAAVRLAKQSERREKNRGRYNEMTGAWRRRNPTAGAEYQRRRKEKDPVFALSQRVRVLLYARLRRGGFTKRSRTHEILGCDYETLAAHMEARFQPSMTWENRGEWHIDRIVPLASAKTEDDVIRLNHYTNLQPLWAADNLAKGARLDWAPQPTGEIV